MLYQDDDFGKELLAGLKDGLAGKDSAIVATASFRATDPTVYSQLITLKGTGCDTLMLFTYAKQAIRKIAELGWKIRSTWPTGPTARRSNRCCASAATT